MPKYNATATPGKSNPMRIAITYPVTTGRSFRCSPGGSSPSGRRVQALAPRILRQPGPQDADGQERQAVERYGHTFGTGVL